MQSCQLDLESAKTHFLFVFSAQKVEKSLPIAPTAPYTELFPTTLWDYNALKSVCSNLRLDVIEVRKSKQRRYGWPDAQMVDARARGVPSTARTKQKMQRADTPGFPVIKGYQRNP
jgi:hypothetical protein